MIIDAHCHAGYAGVFTGPGERDCGLANYARRARAAGIGRTLLMAAPVGEYRQANRDVGAVVSRQPRRFFGFVFVNAVGDRGGVANAVDEARRWGACGIKVHWSDGEITDEIAEVARARRMPILYDPRGDIATVRRFASVYDEVAWIVPHLSSFADDWRAQVALVNELVALPNLFADTAGVRYFDVLVDAVRRAGAHKILFGSDGPFLHPGVELAKIRALGLSPADAEAVLGTNILRLIRTTRRTW